MLRQEDATAQPGAQVARRNGEARLRELQGRPLRRRMSSPVCYTTMGGDDRERAAAVKVRCATFVVRHVSFVDCPGHSDLITTNNASPQPLNEIDRS